MNFYVPRPYGLPYPDFGIEEVGSCIVVLSPVVDDFDGFSRRGAEVGWAKHLVLPDVVQQNFFHKYKYEFVGKTYVDWWRVSLQTKQLPAEDGQRYKLI